MSTEDMKRIQTITTTTSSTRVGMTISRTTKNMEGSTDMRRKESSESLGKTRNIILTRVLGLIRK
jgi:hypothetical protein